MAYYLAPSLSVLRGEINARWPKRDRGSDGWIGDEKHARTESDHNPNARGAVTALDIDKDGIDPMAVIAAAIRHPSTNYVIYNRKIYSRNRGFTAVRYTGSNPHDKHLHVSVINTRAAEQDKRPWGIQGEGSDEDMGFFDQTQLDKRTGAQLVKDLWWGEFKGNDLSVTQRMLKQVLQESAAARLREEAILTAVTKGQGTQQILTRIDQLAAAEAARDEQAALERAALAELVEQARDGRLDAAEVVARIGELLTASAGPVGQG